jgi:hypothetical protein
VLGARGLQGGFEAFMVGDHSVAGVFFLVLPQVSVESFFGHGSQDDLHGEAPEDSRESVY